MAQDRGVLVQWLDARADFEGEPPSARCGHVAVAVDNRDVWNEEFLVVHGGIDASRHALSDVVALQVSQSAWFRPEPSAVGPAGRAFHCAAAVGSVLFVFGGHVFLREQSKIHHFNDLWALDTSSWEWLRLETPTEEPAPTPRDRASLVALPDGRLVLYGGADARARRLEDAWVIDPSAQIEAWRRGKAEGAFPGRDGGYQTPASPAAAASQGLLFPGPASPRRTSPTALPARRASSGPGPSSSRASPPLGVASPRLPTPTPPAAGAPPPLSSASLPLSHWREIAAPLPHPKGRCCVAAARVGSRVLFFGGDIGGASADVWSLRVDPDPIDGAAGPGPAPALARAPSPSPGAPGALPPGPAFSGGRAPGPLSSPSPPPPPPLLSLRPPPAAGPPPFAPLPTPGAWTPLSLAGPSPPPLRGHAAAAAGRFVLIFGGVTEPRGLLGLKGRPEHSDAVAVLDRSPPGVRWREPIPTAPPPPAREKHTLTAVRDGRVLLFGGTDGTTTLGDAWWMRVDADDAEGEGEAEGAVLGGGGVAAAGRGAGAGAPVAPVRTVPHPHPHRPPYASDPDLLLSPAAGRAGDAAQTSAGSALEPPPPSLLDDASNPLIDLGEATGVGAAAALAGAPALAHADPAAAARAAHPDGPPPPPPPPPPAPLAPGAAPPGEDDLAGVPPGATFNATYPPHHPRRLSLEQAFPETLAEWPAPAIEEQRRELERIQRERERGREAERGAAPDLLTGEAEGPEDRPPAPSGPGAGQAAEGPAPPAPAAAIAAPAAHAPSYAMTTLASGASSLLGALPAVPSNLSSAFGSLRGRLGLPAIPAPLPGRGQGTGATGEGATVPPPLGALASAYDPALLALGERVWRRQRRAAEGASASASESGGEGGGEAPPSSGPAGEGEGRPASESAGSLPASAGTASVPPPSREILARTARRFLSTCEAREVRLGDLEALVADYRRWAVVGWRQALERGGVEGPPALGRFLHVSAGDLRVRDVPDLLNEYRQLVASITGGQD